MVLYLMDLMLKSGTKKIDEIEKDNSRLLKVKQEAKRTVNEDYTWDSIIKRFIENLPAQFKF